MRENKTSKTEATAEIGEAGVTRRGALECMVWAGTGVLWTVSGGVPKSLGLLEEVLAAEAPSFTFLQISDSHIGFNKSANPDALGTLREAIAKVKAVPAKPAFMIHTGDITHLSRPDEFDNANQLISEAALDVHYVPGEHDFVDEGMGKVYLARYGKGTRARAGTPSTIMNGAFRSSALDTNDAFTQTFPTAGTIEYFCAIHPHDRKDHRDALKWRYTQGSATSTG